MFEKERCTFDKERCTEEANKLAKNGLGFNDIFSSLFNKSCPELVTLDDLKQIIKDAIAQKEPVVDSYQR